MAFYAKPQSRGLTGSIGNYNIFGPQFDAISGEPNVRFGRTLRQEFGRTEQFGSALTLLPNCSVRFGSADFFRLLLNSSVCFAEQFG